MLGHAQGAGAPTVSLLAISLDWPAGHLHMRGVIGLYTPISSPVRIRAVNARVQQNLRHASFRGRRQMRAARFRVWGYPKPKARFLCNNRQLPLGRRACDRLGRTPAAISSPSTLHTPCAPCCGSRGVPTENAGGRNRLLTSSCNRAMPAREGRQSDPALKAALRKRQICAGDMTE